MIELLGAIFILSISITATLSILTSVLKGVSHVRTSEGAVSVTESIMEGIIADLKRDFNKNHNLNEKTPVNATSQYLYSIEEKVMTETANPQSFSSKPILKEIRVTIYYPSKDGEKSYTLFTRVLKT